ncbi:hypothetical protein GSF08_04465 [Clostridiaceae bacterium DONG20-135]|uniref:Uncharacterized protein n=1 Tax=Copranaerobaculum intestinale TaxID=2692629 RepID=A0A6N8U4Q7_9FIRM|nr:hypothetical protein [Copranaerobaculum intestinale]MXQ73188.1 hypothetical protein [Copranaerobaculum intestinale]
MKKITKCMLGALMTGAMLTPVHAEEATTSIQYSKTSEYTLSIDSSVTVSSTTETEQAIKVSNVNTKSNEKVQIAIKSGVGSNGKVTLTRDDASGVTTEVTASLDKNGAGIGANEVIAEFEDQSTTATKGGKLYYSKIPADAAAGSYTGTIVYVGSVVARN